MLKKEMGAKVVITGEQNYFDLSAAKDLVYNPCGFTYSSATMKIQNATYEACAFELNGLKIQFRVAKITPKKIGQFVGIYKRNDKGIIAPYDVSDDVDFLVINIKVDNNFGQFVFPKSVLVDKGVFSVSDVGGKRGMRVYPSWDTPINKQAKKTQLWQLNYFLKIPSDKPIDCSRVKLLYSFSY